MGDISILQAGDSKAQREPGFDVEQVMKQLTNYSRKDRPARRYASISGTRKPFLDLIFPQVLYGEDVYVGYRIYDTIKRPTLWPFGSGLSYTTFSLSNLQVQQKPGGRRQLLLIDVTVKNTGEVDGAEVVQVYVSQRMPSIKRPVKELKGFSKVSVEASKSTVARLVIERKYATSF